MKALRFSLWLLAVVFPVISQAQTCPGDPGCFYQTALSDIPSQTYYNGFTGGLYGNWTNSPTPTQLARLTSAVGRIQALDSNGNACTTGTNSNPCKIAMLTMGMSIGKFEWSGALGGDTGQFISPQNADIYSVLWWMGEATNQMQQPMLNPPPVLNPYFDAVVGNMNGHFAASWVNDNMNGTFPGNYTQVLNNALSPQWQAKMYHSKGVQQYIIDSNGNVEEATNVTLPINGAGQSGPTQPVWSLQVGGQTDDGGIGPNHSDPVVWQNDGPQNGMSQTNIVYSLKPPQVQVLHISNFTGLNYAATGTVTTQAHSTTINYVSGTQFGTRNESDGGWDNFPLELLNQTNKVTCGGKQCIVASVSTGTVLNTTVPVDVGVTANYILGLATATSTSPVCDGTWWTPQCPNWQFLGWLLAQDLRQGQVEYPNNKVTLLGGVDYCDYYRVGPQYCGEPWNYETWLSTQALVMDQDAEMNSQVALTSCSGSSGSETCSAASLPSQYHNGVYVHVSGISSNPSLNTPCAPTSCSGAVATVNGSTVTFSNPGASGTVNNLGHMTVIPDPIMGSLESSDGTAAAIAISEYTWAPGPGGPNHLARRDGFGLIPPEAFAYDGVHPSSNEHQSGCSTGNGCNEAQTCSSGVYGDNPNWRYISTTAWCGQGFLSNQTFNFITNYAYFYSQQNWFTPVICAANHQTSGCR
jgi:hypothetical protein